MTHHQAGCICVNGRVLDPENATVSVLDAGFLLGDGLFESLRAVDGALYLLDRHLQRLLSAAGDAGFADVPTRESLEAEVRETLSRSGLRDAYVRVTITRGTGGQGLAPPPGPPTIVIAALPAPPLTDHDLKVTLLHQRPPSSVGAKSTSWQHAVLAKQQVIEAGADEGFYVSDAGHVMEGVSSNLFVVHGRRVSTPPVTQCLSGITRARVLELLAGLGTVVEETPIGVAELMRADGVFVTNAVQGLRRVVAIGDDPVGRRDPDEIFATLKRAYERDRASTLELAT